MKILRYICLFILLLSPSVWAAGPYYIDATSGNDSNNGLSGDDEGGGVGPWLTLAKIDTANIGTSEDVYLLCGETWTGEDIDVNYNGTSGDYAIVGAYYMVGSTETIGVNGDGKPIVYGAADYSYPAAETSPLVDGGTADYIQFENLDVQYSGGYGFRNTWGATLQIINNCDFSYTQNTAVKLRDNYTTFEYCTVHHFGMREAPTPSAPWPAGIDPSAAGCIVRYNEIYEGYGEGIGPHDTTLLEIYNNYVRDVYSVGIYLNAVTSSKVYNNLIIGTDETTFRHYTSPDYHGAGIKVQIESNYSRASSNNVIHNNIVINTYAGIGVQNSKDDPLYEVENNTYVNNTLIDNYRNVYIWNSDGNLDTSGNVFKNNLSYDNHADSANVTIVTNDITAWDADYNGWYPSYNEAETGLSGANDVTGDPTFPKSTWRGTSSLNDQSFTISDLGPTAGVIDAGVDLGADYDDAWMSSSDKPGPSTSITTGDQDSYGVGWEIGAVLETPTGSSRVIFISENKSEWDIEYPLFAVGAPGNQVIIMSRINVGLIFLM